MFSLILLISGLTVPVELRSVEVATEIVVMACGESLHRILFDLWYLKFVFQECNSCCSNSPGRSVVALLPVQRGAHMWLSLSPQTQTMSMPMDFSTIFPVSIVRFWVCCTGFQWLKTGFCFFFLTLKKQIVGCQNDLGWKQP